MEVQSEHRKHVKKSPVTCGYLYFPAHGSGPSPQPQFVFDNSGPNVNLAALTLNLHLSRLDN